MSWRFRSVWVTLAVAAACHGDQLAFVDIPVTISATSAWSGGLIVISSAAFVGADSLPLVLAGTETLTVATAGPESVAVRLPYSNDFVTLSVTLSTGEQGNLEPVRVYGFISSSPAPPIAGNLQPYPGNGNPTALAYANGRLVLANLQSGLVAPYGGSADTVFGNCLAGPTVSALDPSIITVGRVSGGVCHALAVTLTTPLSVVDSGPVAGNVFPAIYLGPGRWLIHQKSQLLAQASGGSYYDLCSGEGFGFVPSPPPVQRVVSTMCYNPGGLPIYDAQTGLHAYTLATSQIFAATFTDRGDTLYLLARNVDRTRPAVLWVLNAVTGVPIDSASYPEFGSSADLALDPGGRWLYVVNGNPSAQTRPRVRVYDRATMQQVGWLRDPTPYDASYLWYWRLVIGADHVLYLGMTGNPGLGTALVSRFALMP